MKQKWILGLALMSLMGAPLCGGSEETPPTEEKPAADEALRQRLLDMGHTFSAIYEHDFETLKSYLDNGGSPNLRMPTPSMPLKDGTPFLDATAVTLLYAAMQANQKEMVSLLLERGADPNAYCMGSTPLLVNRMEMDPLISPKHFGTYDTPTNMMECTEALQSRLEIGRMLIAYGGIADWGPYWRREWAKKFRAFLSEAKEPVIYALNHKDRIDFYRDGVIHQVAIPANMSDFRTRLDFTDSLGEWLNTQKTSESLNLCIIRAPDAENYLYRLERWAEANRMTVSDIRISDYVNCDPLTVFKLFTDPENPLSEKDQPYRDFCGGPPYYGTDPEGTKTFFDSDIETIRAHYAELMNRTTEEERERRIERSKRKAAAKGQPIKARE